MTDSPLAFVGIILGAAGLVLVLLARRSQRG
jgi:hypothetical protein